MAYYGAAMRANARAYEKMLRNIAEKTGLTYLENANTVFDYYNGYHIAITREYGQFTYIQVSVRKDGQLPTAQELTAFAKSVKCVSRGYLKNNKACFQISALTMKKAEKNAIEAVSAVTEYFKANGYVDVCEYCGNPTSGAEINALGCEGNISHLCESCAANVEKLETQRILESEAVEENVVAGIIGALLGSIVGVIAILLIGRAGYISALGGIVMAVATVFGYEKLAKKITGKGIAVCVITMIVMVFVAEKLDWCIEIYDIMKSEDVAFLDLYARFFYVLEIFEATKEFFLDLGLLYVFTLLGAFPTIKKKIAERKYINDVVDKSGMAA